MSSKTRSPSTLWASKSRRQRRGHPAMSAINKRLLNHTLTISTSTKSKLSLQYVAFEVNLDGQLFQAGSVGHSWFCDSGYRVFFTSSLVLWCSDNHASSTSYLVLWYSGYHICSTQGRRSGYESGGGTRRIGV